MNTVVKIPINEQNIQTTKLNGILPLPQNIDELPEYKDGPLTQPSRAVGCYDGEQIYIPMEMAFNQLKMRRDVAKEMLEGAYTNELDGGKEYKAIPTNSFDQINDKQHTALRTALNLHFLPFQDSFWDDMESMLTQKAPYIFSSEQVELLKRLQSVISLFPELAAKLGMGSEPDRLLTLPEVARILEVPEATVRMMAIEGTLEFTKTQGETGHYRFKHSIIREFVESKA
ncbi:MAG: helix-turn-helix domain-containing protein [Candidatus Marinimicrobia bacterium]|nr:helix-turn-helix domain-containing protein [Candidatus Neomarinimicrobiota bacterium]